MPDPFALCRERDLGPTSWLQETDKAVEWMNGHLAGLPAKHGVCDAVKFIEHSLHAPGQAKGWIKACRTKAVRVFPPEEDKPEAPACPPTNGRPFICEECSSSQVDLHTLRAHMWGQHRKRMLLCQLAPHTRCPACLTEFWQPRRLQRHFVHDSIACGHHVLAASAAPAPPERLQHAHQERILPKDTLPATRVCGPLPAPLHEWVSAEQLLKLQSFFDDCGEDAADVELAARRCLSEFAAANVATRDAFREWLGLEKDEILDTILATVRIA